MKTISEKKAPAFEQYITDLVEEKNNVIRQVRQGKTDVFNRKRLVQPLPAK